MPFCGKYTVPCPGFDKGVVGAKARNTLALNESLGGGKIPSWIKLPKSMVIPFGVMEHVMNDPVERRRPRRSSRSLERAMDDSSEQALEASLPACRECVLELVPPAGMHRRDPGGDAPCRHLSPEDERWEMAWRA